MPMYSHITLGPRQPRVTSYGMCTYEYILLGTENIRKMTSNIKYIKKDEMRQRVEENLLVNEVGLKMRVRETARKNTKIEPDSLTHTQTSLSVSESVSRNSCEHHLCLYLSPSLHPLLIHSAPVHSTFHAFIHQPYHLPTHSFFLFIKSSTSFFSVLIQSPIHSFIHSNFQRVPNIYLIINPCPIPIMPSTC